MISVFILPVNVIEFLSGPDSLKFFIFAVDMTKVPCSLTLKGDLASSEASADEILYCADSDPNDKDS